MSNDDSFEARLRAIAEEISKSMQRISEVDIEALSRRYGADADGARAFADAAGKWLNDRVTAGDPGETQAGSGPGPHPLDLPTGEQGVALSALDSGRWTVRSGSNELAGTGVGAGPVRSDVVGELRGRDWITADGTLTLVGRHALSRWCRTVEALEPPPSAAPPT
jgi:hypothetical protein